MHDAMARQHLPRAPWRELASVMTKWQPSHFKDEVFTGVTPLQPAAGAAGPSGLQMLQQQQQGAGAPGSSAAAAVIAALKPGESVAPSSVYLTTRAGTQKVRDPPAAGAQGVGQGAAGARAAQSAVQQPPQQQQARVVATGPPVQQPPRAQLVVQGAHAEPRTVIVGFQARPAPAHNHGAGCAAGVAGAAQAAAGWGAAECNRSVGSFTTTTGRSYASGSAVSSLSDEFALTSRLERRAAHARKRAVQGQGQAQGQDHPRPPLPPQQPQPLQKQQQQQVARMSAGPAQRHQQQQGPAASGSGLHGLPTKAAPAAGLAKPAAPTSALQGGAMRAFLPLDQLLPSIHKVRLGRN